MPQLPWSPRIDNSEDPRLSSAPRNTQVPPIQAHRDWRFLVRDLERSRPALRGASRSHLVNALLPAVSTAWWLVTFRPELLVRNKLRLLCPGAGNREAVDGGRWWRVLPWLLGKPDDFVDVVVLGDQLAGLTEDGRKVAYSTDLPPAELHRRLRSPLAEQVASWAPAELINGRLADWHQREAGAQGRPDLVVLFSPGFEAHHDSWLTEDALLPLLRVGVPMACFAYSPLDQQVDAHVLGLYGLTVPNDRVVPNPWLLEEMHSLAGGFAGIGWEWVARPQELAQPLQVDEEGLRRWMAAQDLVKPQFQQYGDAYLEHLGSIELVQGPQGEVRLLALPGNLLVEMHSGLVLEWDQEDEELYDLEPELRIDVQLMQDWPEQSLLLRMLRAIELYRDHLAPFVAPPGFDELAELLGIEPTKELREFLRTTQPEPVPVKATDGSAAFFNALAEGDWARVEALRASDPTLLHAQDAAGKTALMRLYDAGQVARVHDWVRTGAPVNHLDAERQGLIHDVIRKDDVATLQLLAHHGQDLNLPAGAGFVPALLCVTYHAWQCLGFLADQADVDLGRRSLMGRSLKDEFEGLPLLPRLKDKLRARFAAA